MRNSLRLFGLLAVLAGVNVYVFFFNRGTAPREVLKPSSLVKGMEGRAGVLNAATGEASVAAGLAERDSFATPSATIVDKKARVPVPIAPGSAPLSQQTKAGKPKPPIVAGGAPPKALPGGNPGPDTAVPPKQASDPSDVPAPDPQSAVEKTFGESDTLGQVLGREGFESDATRVVAALSRFIDPRLIRGGQGYTVRLNDDGEPESFEYHPNPVTRVVATRGHSGSWIATRVDQSVETKVASISGTIDSTLYESVQISGENGALVGLLVELLAWDVNFYTDTHPGDHWKVMVEKQFLGGQFYRYGHILAAEYGGRVGTFRSFYWQPPRSDGAGAYYDEKGQAISKSLLKTPLRYVRVSSKFDRHRFHPILHRERAHLGIDYAAPVGTPVWASSSGKVVECQMKRGSGNTVVLGHANGMTTRYYHLSRFARGLKPGNVVKQKQVIGFVGTTGLSTGPHLHFSVTKNGAFVDPNKVQINRAPPVADRTAFVAAIKPRVAILQALEPSALARN